MIHEPSLARFDEAPLVSDVVSLPLGSQKVLKVAKQQVQLVHGLKQTFALHLWTNT